MEMENRYASNAKGNTGVALASAALGVGVLNGGLGNLLGGWGANNCSGDNAHISRYEAGMQAKISELETEVKLRDANTYTLGEVGKLRDYMDNRFDRVEREICDQKVFNATQIGTLSCIQNQVTQLYGITDHITERIIPIEKVCPRPMARYNSWAAPSAEAATTPAG